jgi:hypothetical protein
LDSESRTFPVIGIAACTSRPECAHQRIPEPLGRGQPISKDWFDAGSSNDAVEEEIPPKKERRNCAGKKVKPLTQNRHPGRPLERRRLPQRLIARTTLAASLICGAIAGTGINSLAQSSQPDYKQAPTPLTKSSQIDRRRIGPVILAASGPTRQAVPRSVYFLCRSRVLSATAQSSSANRRRLECFCLSTKRAR